jgi:hypothetical protein
MVFNFCFFDVLFLMFLMPWTRSDPAAQRLVRFSSNRTATQGLVPHPGE